LTYKKLRVLTATITNRLTGFHIWDTAASGGMVIVAVVMGKAMKTHSGQNKASTRFNFDTS